MKQLFTAIFSLFVCLFSNAQSISKWDGISSSTDWYYSSSGPIYYINSASDLAGLSKLVAPGPYVKFTGQTIILTTNIDLNNHEWEPIGGFFPGNYYYTFCGIFDGNGKTVSGLNISKFRDNSLYSIGLFGCLFDSNAIIKNLSLKGEIDLQHEDNGAKIGAITGENNATIINCKTDVSISVTASNGAFCKSYIGGIVGKSSSPITKCVSSGAITATHNNKNDPNVGGIVGNNLSTISECSSSSNISIIGGSQGKIGGIADQNNVENCIYSGEIKINSGNHIYAGGIIGMSGSVYSCIMVGSISGVANYLYTSPIKPTTGGSDIISNCYYLDEINNPSNQGIPISEYQFKNGHPLNGLDPNVWSFSEGEFPFLKFLENFPTNTEQIITSNISVGINGNSIIVCNATPKSKIIIFDVTGKIIKQQSINSTEERIDGLKSNNIYIVRLDNQSFKIIL